MSEFDDYDWQCRDCGRQWARDYFCFPVKCPKCDSTDITTIGQARRDEAINHEDDYRAALKGK